jgi:hypothetical protein
VGEDNSDLEATGATNIEDVGVGGGYKALELVLLSLDMGGGVQKIVVNLLYV